MKRILLLLALLSPFASQAQTVPNGGLETWTQTGTREKPQSWSSFDDALADQGIPFVLNFLTKSTDRHAGSFAAQLQSRALPIPIPIPGFTGFIPSALILGSIAGAGLDADVTEVGGVPFTSRPGSVRFWYKLTLAPNDTAYAATALFRGPRATQQSIGEGFVALDANRSTFTQGSYNIDYAPGTQAPDTLRMLFVAGTGNAAASSSFIVDEITFGARILSNKPARELAAALSVYPNPSSTGEFALASLDNPEVATAPLTVTDALGREVYREKAAPRSFFNGRALNLQGQAPGVYMLRLETNAGPVTRRLVIR